QHPSEATLAFWKNLQGGFARFEKEHKALAVGVKSDGRYEFRAKSLPEERVDSARMACMTRICRVALLTGLFAIVTTAFWNPAARAQTGTGGLEFVAHVTPTAARPEPVRQFTFYVLTKSYDQIAKDVEAEDMLPERDKFIDELKVSAELKV